MNTFEKSQQLIKFMQWTPTQDSTGFWSEEFRYWASLEVNDLYSPYRARFAWMIINHAYKTELQSAVVAWFEAHMEMLLQSPYEEGVGSLLDHILNEATERGLI